MKIKGTDECNRHAERHEVLLRAWTEHAIICDKYFRLRAPNGRAYSMDLIAREYRISPGTVEKIIRTAVRQKEGNLLQEQIGEVPKVGRDGDVPEVVG